MRNEVQINFKCPEAQEGKNRFSIPHNFLIKLMLFFFFPKIPLTKCVAWWWEHGADIVSSETPADLWSILLFWLCALFPSVLLQQVLWVEQDLKTVILAGDKSPDVFPSNRDVDWEKCETSCCWYVKWRCSDPVLQKCLFLPKCTENN